MTPTVLVENNRYNMETPKIDLYMGTIASVVNPQSYEITADIPGVAEGVRAYPFTRGEMDEPVPGNTIFLLSVDPIYHSFYLYTKFKENDFIGIRSNGKVVTITPDAIKIGVTSAGSVSDEVDPGLDVSEVSMDSGGNIKTMATGDITIDTAGNIDIKASGKMTVNISGSADINVSGSTTLNSPDVKITGGQLTVNGSAAPTGTGGFCGIPNCIFSGVPHIGNVISGT